MRTYSFWNIFSTIFVVLFGLILIARLGQIIDQLASINDSLQKIQVVFANQQKSVPEQTEPQKSTPEQTDTPVRE